MTMKAKSLLVATAVIELPTGAGLLVAPSFLAELLLGEALVSAASMVVGRVAGAALVAIGLICWLERAGDRPGSLAGLLAGLLVYHCAVALALVHGALFKGLSGVLLWPVVAVHIVFALWCAVQLRHSSAGVKPTR
jgi:nitrate reductase gamma subunit